jgi:type II secretory pathway component PulF
MAFRPARVPLGELAVFCRKMAFLFTAGAPIKEMLPILAAQTKGQALKSVLPELNARVLQGESLAGAMRAVKVFPGFMCGYIAIGEMTARLPRVCEQLADLYERQAAAEDELAAALVYPIAVTVMMLGVIVLAVAFVLPGYTQVFEASNVALPALTRGLLLVSAFVAGNGFWLLVGLCATVIAVAVFMRGERGRYVGAALRLRFPPSRYGINLRLAQALSLLLGAGQHISDAVPVCADVIDNIKVKRDIRGLHTALTAGKPFWEALSAMPYLDPLLVGMARVGEETGRLPQTMEQCQVYFTNTYQRMIKRINKLVEPVITLILGILLALVMLAVLLPTFDLATAI